ADAACAVGATYKGRKFGDLADISVLSFNGNKTITCGGGGAVAGNDEELLSLVRHLTTTARCGSEYDFDMVGFNYRMTNVQAAIGCAQMERLEEFVERKRVIRRFYDDEFKDTAAECFAKSEGSSCWFSGIVLPKPEGIEEVRGIIARMRENGIEGRTFWKPVHLQKVYMDCPRSDVSVSEGIWDRIVTLPCSTGITDEQLAYVAGVVKKEFI
ncbi:MAG: DegT/DnrJ/EryC1/StrS family aminotransferase, partial [Lachnospiraceae bacterium]|nr:DegT/DnrJ/EryC1/StrS family aminotransferase [Lachnospiraceae bacterium]